MESHRETLVAVLSQTGFSSSRLQNVRSRRILGGRLILCARVVGLGENFSLSGEHMIVSGRAGIGAIFVDRFS